MKTPSGSLIRPHEGMRSVALAPATMPSPLASTYVPSRPIRFIPINECQKPTGSSTSVPSISSQSRLSRSTSRSKSASVAVPGQGSKMILSGGTFPSARSHSAALSNRRGGMNWTTGIGGGATVVTQFDSTMPRVRFGEWGTAGEPVSRGGRVGLRAGGRPRIGRPAVAARPTMPGGRRAELQVRGSSRRMK